MSDNHSFGSAAFSMPRFISLAKAELSLNKNFYLKLCLSIVGCLMAIAILFSISTMPQINEVKAATYLSPEEIADKCQSISKISADIMFTMFAWLCSIALTVFASLTFINLRSKKSRISALMIPASQVEKFTLRLCVYGIGGLITLTVGILLSILIIEISFKGGGFFLQCIANAFSSNYASLAWIILLASLCISAVYTLGSSLWPRLSWLKTWLVIMVIQWVFGAGFITLLSSGMNIPEALKDMLGWLFDDSDMVVGFLISSEIIFIAACLILSWWRYRNVQIIQRFMMK